MNHRRLEIVHHDRPGYTAEGMKSVLETSQKRLRILSPDRFAIGFSGKREHDAKNMRTLHPAVRLFDGCPLTEINLDLVTRLTFHSAKRQGSRSSQPTHQSLDAVVTALKAVLCLEILVNPLNG